jgi:hypothetical protein
MIMPRKPLSLIGPDLARQVVVDLGRVPVVGNGAQRLALVVEEGLLGRRELWLRIGQQFLPGGLA